MNDDFEQERVCKKRTHWPRRLLHIPSMRSIERSEDANYDHHHEPKYATLSYTWGRYENPGGPSLHVLNVPWAIPSVDPKHFTVMQLQNVIDSIKLVSSLDFLWLDVACLDFSNASASFDDGIIWQKEIFGSAYQSFVWLSQIDSRMLSVILQDLFEATTYGQHATDRDLQADDEICSYLRHKARSAFKELLTDPWFTSLWTLQEAMINPDAILLCCDGSPVPARLDVLQIDQGPQMIKFMFEDDSSNQYTPLNVKLANCEYSSIYYGQTGNASLLQLARVSRVILGLLDSLQPQQAHWSDLQDLRSLIHQSGLPAFINFNVLKFSELAQIRAKARPQAQLEYLYRSVLGHTFAQRPDEELDYAAFTRHILTHFPVSAHIFIRSRPQIGRNSWLYTPGCMHPDVDLLFQCADHFVPLLTTVIVMDERVTFMGSGFYFNAVMDHLLQDSRPGGGSRLLGIAFDRSDVQLMCHCNISVPMRTALPQRLLHVPLATETWHIDATKNARVVRSFQRVFHGTNDNVKVLLLACSRGMRPDALALAIGLIICRVSENKWQRLGWCFWVYTATKGDTRESVGSSFGLGKLPIVRISGDTV
ncbi:hypothetical protein AA0119_g13091 [Alternaria tenuissima]|uniref:Heterokaryon incompatibility domain-containing protein n=1 Tax=Alternaria tenuissima TaxID=119927 RepID=A0A4Q4SA65_9PLEO|nr:hypothetical protein AA0115_g10844 [Alternaria tenuissima]RYN85813.1 hypothetical protein AA0119_g13091 [Alternaria tenuissima]RYO07607.1 hypothetical protein AA0121_g11719 [Alternaria tenuissima]RYO66759.1 hypothetical protein AA0116_g2892 [Alternaria tenuissima]